MTLDHTVELCDREGSRTPELLRAKRISPQFFPYKVYDILAGDKVVFVLLTDLIPKEFRGSSAAIMTRRLTLVL